MCAMPPRKRDVLTSTWPQLSSFSFALGTAAEAGSVLMGVFARQCGVWIAECGPTCVLLRVICPAMGAILFTLLLVGWEDLTAMALERAQAARAYLAYLPHSIVLGALALVVGMWTPLFALSFLYQCELLPLYAGLSLGWLRGTVAALAWQMLWLVIFANISRTRLLDDEGVQTHIFEGFSDVVRLASRARASIEAGNRSQVGILYGFLVAPALVKDVVAAGVFRAPAPQLVAWRLPSATFYAGSLAYFGHRAFVLAANGPARRDGPPVPPSWGLPGYAEEVFCVVLMAALVLAGSLAQRELDRAGLGHGNLLQAVIFDGEELPRGRAAPRELGTPGQSPQAWMPLRPGANRPYL